MSTQSKGSFTKHKHAQSVLPGYGYAVRTDRHGFLDKNIVNTINENKTQLNRGVIYIKDQGLMMIF